MAGFDDLLAEAQPYLDWEEMAVTQGTTWVWSYVLTDNSGALVDLTSGYTATLEIRHPNDTASLVSVTVTFPAAGVVQCKAIKSITNSATPGLYCHELTIVRTSDTATLVAVGSGASWFVVNRKVAL